MNGEKVIDGLMAGGKVAATAIPAAVATDMALQQWGGPTAARPAGLSYGAKLFARLAAGTLVTAGALALEVPTEYAVGPMVGGFTLGGVEAARYYDLLGKIRSATAPAAPRT